MNALPLFLVGKLLVSRLGNQRFRIRELKFQHWETVVSAPRNNSFNDMETMVSPRETSVPLSGKANDLLLSDFYLLNSTSKLAPSLQLNCKTVCFLSEEITLQNGVSSTFHCPFIVTVTGISLLAFSIHGRE